MTRLVGVFFFWGLWASVWALDVAEWVGEAEVETSSTVAGFHCLTIEPWVFDACRANLADLRIVDEEGNETPYVLFWGQKSDDAFLESVWDAKREEDLVPCPFLSAEVQEDEESRETVLSLDLGFRRLPLESLAIRAENAYFYRDFEIEGRDTEKQEVKHRTETGWDTREVESQWLPVTRGVVFRVIESQGVREQLTVENLPTSFRFLRIRIKNQDNPPLRIENGGILIFRREVRLVFEVVAGKAYRLLYGNERVGRPLYDLKISVTDLEAEGLPLAKLGERAEIEKPEKPLPWSERHALTIWIATLVCMVAVLWLLLTQLRNVKSVSSDGSER